MEYTHWHPGQPTGGDEDCLLKAFLYSNNGDWHDYECDSDDEGANHALCQTKKSIQNILNQTKHLLLILRCFISENDK